MDNLNLWNSCFVREAPHPPSMVKCPLCGAINPAAPAITTTPTTPTIALDGTPFSSQTQLQNTAAQLSRDQGVNISADSYPFYHPPGMDLSEEALEEEARERRQQAKLERLERLRGNFHQEAQGEGTYPSI
jgi:hypothetical protein